jgi:hypothetical protein
MEWQKFVKGKLEKGMESTTKSVDPRIKIQRDSSGNVTGLTRPMIEPDPVNVKKVTVQPTELNVPKMHNGTENVMDEQEKARTSKERGAAATKYPSGSQEQRDFIAKQGELEAGRGGISSMDKSRLDAQTQAVQVSGKPQKYQFGTSYVQPMDQPLPPVRQPSMNQMTPRMANPVVGAPPVMHKGTEEVPAVLEKGERVISKDHNKKLGGMSNLNLIRSALAFNKGKQAPSQTEEMPKPEKELKELRIRPSKNGGHIIEHHFTHPEAHQMEEHTSSNMEELHNHLHEAFGIPHGDQAIAAADASAQGGE